MALLEILETTDDLDTIVNAFVWAHDQARLHNSTRSHEDRVIDIARSLRDTLEPDALAVVAAALVDRLVDAQRREAGWETL